MEVPIRKRLGEILIAKKLITQEQLKECLEQQRITKEYIGVILLKKHIVKEEDLLNALSEQFNMPCVSLKTVYIDWDLCAKFNSVISVERRALPIRQDERVVVVAISDPLDVLAVAKIEELARPKKLNLVLVSQVELEEFIREVKKRSRGSLLKGLLDGE